MTATPREILAESIAVFRRSGAKRCAIPTETVLRMMCTEYPEAYDRARLNKALSKWQTTLSFGEAIGLLDYNT